MHHFLLLEVIGHAQRLAAALEVVHVVLVASIFIDDESRRLAVSCRDTLGKRGTIRSVVLEYLVTGVVFHCHMGIVLPIREG